MAAARTTTLIFRIQPVLEGALRATVDHERRSIANMVEMLIRDYCGRNGVKIPKQRAPPSDK